MKLNNKSNSIIFDELGFTLKQKRRPKGIRPFIIFYDKKMITIGMLNLEVLLIKIVAIMNKEKVKF